MRFERIHIPAFGPFTNLEINFPANNGDLHIIYGTNEAGKSSLLRAFRDLLFGIHSQSPDNFLHDYKKMRIAGDIVNKAGKRLSFQRRKGNKNTLLDATGNELPDSVLTDFLGSVDLTYFSAMFGLGTKELHEGAEQLLRGEGDIGNALFSASMGGTPVQKVLAALTEESDRLFKGRATANVSIRPTTNEYKELMRNSRDSVVSPDAWEKLEKDLATAEDDCNRLKIEISEITKSLEWISRCEDALPTAGLLGEEMRKLELLPLLPAVSGDFVERARAAREAVRDAHAEVNRLTAEIGKLETQLTGCQTAPALLNEADVLDNLHQGLGVYRDRRNSLTDLETELAGLESTLRAGMQNLNLGGNFDQLETLRLNSASRIACEEAASNLQKALEKRDKNQEKTEDIKAQIKSLETQLQSMPEIDLTNLREALSNASRVTEANTNLANSQSEVKRLTLEIKSLHEELFGAPKDLDLTASLTVPSKAIIRRAEETMDGINRDINGVESKIVEGTKLIKSMQAELSRLERLGELPSEEALCQARELRDHGWCLVLANWKGNGSTEEFVPGTPLEEAFPQTILQADGIADRMREHAEAVAQAEEKRFQIIQTEKQNLELNATIEELKNKLKVAQTSWEAEWRPCGITPSIPAEMEEWREAWSRFKDILRQLRDAEVTFQQKSLQIQEARKLLASVLAESAAKEFTFLYEKAIRQVRQGEESSGRRIELIHQLQGVKLQLEPLEQNNTRMATAVEDAMQKWKALCQKVGMPEDIPPKSGLLLLQERKELITKFDNWKEISSNAEKTKVSVAQYEQNVSKKAVALGAVGDTAETQEINLWKMLTNARDAKTRHDQLDAQLQEAKNTLYNKQLSYTQADKELKELVQLAKLETVEALEPLLANLELRDQAQRQIDTFRGTLSVLARGQAVDEFLSHIMAENPEELPQQKAMFESQKQERETAIQIANDSLSSLRGKKQTLESAGDTAANYRQQAESCAARIKQDATRFLRLRLATYYLQTQIERFRKENQAPLLGKSGQFFQNITQGAFSGLGPEFNADDTPVLVGMRPDNSTVSIAGMSDGSRDQLYLALRLAALHQYLEKHEPMPLILDDLLITFDDNRVIAILPQLAELAKRTQILLFTHHDHLVKLCHSTLGKNNFNLHCLNAKPSE